jgi:hypothetical protein
VRGEKSDAIRARIESLNARIQEADETIHEHTTRCDVVRAQREGRKVSQQAVHDHNAVLAEARRKRAQAASELSQAQTQYFVTQQEEDRQRREAQQRETGQRERERQEAYRKQQSDAHRRRQEGQRRQANAALDVAQQTAKSGQRLNQQMQDLAGRLTAKQDEQQRRDAERTAAREERESRVELYEQADADRSDSRSDAERSLDDWHERTVAKLEENRANGYSQADLASANPHAQPVMSLTDLARSSFISEDTGGEVKASLKAMTDTAIKDAWLIRDFGEWLVGQVPESPARQVWDRLDPFGAGNEDDPLVKSIREGANRLTEPELQTEEDHRAKAREVFQNIMNAVGGKAEEVNKDLGRFDDVFDK